MFLIIEINSVSILIVNSFICQDKNTKFCSLSLNWHRRTPIDPLMLSHGDRCLFTAIIVIGQRCSASIYSAWLLFCYIGVLSCVVLELNASMDNEK